MSDVTVGQMDSEVVLGPTEQESGQSATIDLEDAARLTELQRRARDLYRRTAAEGFDD